MATLFRLEEIFHHICLLLLHEHQKHQRKPHILIHPLKNPYEEVVPLNLYSIYHLKMLCCTFYYIKNHTVHNDMDNQG